MSSAKFAGKLISVALANWAYGKGARDHDLAMKFTQVLLVIVGTVARSNPECEDFWPYLEFQLLWAQRFLTGTNEFLEQVQDKATLNMFHVHNMFHKKKTEGFCTHVLAGCFAAFTDQRSSE